jgi:hypothetical protein
MGSCTTGEVKKGTQHNGRFQLSLPVGSAEIEPSPDTFLRSWSRRWVGSQIIVSRWEAAMEQGKRTLSRDLPDRKKWHWYA